MSATITEIRARILAITATYPGIGTDISSGDTLYDLPAYTCVAGQAVWRKTSSRRYLVDRTYELWVYVTEITDPNNEIVVRSAFSDCDPLIAGLVDLFGASPRLDLNDSGIVTDTQDIGDSGPAQTPLRGKTYSGFRLLIPTTVYAP